MNNKYKELISERLAQRSMTTGETLPEEQGRKDYVEKNKLLFFLMMKGLMEEYIDFCSWDKEDWHMQFVDMTRM